MQRARRKAFQQLQHGELASAMRTCDRILSSASKDTIALRVLADITEAVDAKVAQFQRKPDSACESDLRKTRHEFVALLQTLPNGSLLTSDALPFANAFTLLLHSGLRDLDRNAEEQATFNNLRNQLTAANCAVEAPTLLALMLLSWSFELPLPASLDAIPESVRYRYSNFLFDLPLVLNRTGEAETCATHLEKLMLLFHQEVIREHASISSAESHKLAEIAANRAFFLQAYFTTRNLRPMMQMRGDLMAVALMSTGATILKALPPRQPPGKKIKLGILTVAFASTTDAYFITSHLDFLDRQQFHITLFAFQSTGHALERHCISRADQFVILPPNEFKEQAERIRAADLDLLMFGINQAITVSSSAMLGCLRLARTQIATVSSPVTTGLHHIDVMLSAENNEAKPDAQRHYTEQLLLMPGSINVYAYQYDTELATLSFTRFDLGIAADTIVFFSGANFFKIIPELSLTWANILAGVPNSVLVLMPFNPNWSNKYRASPFLSRIHKQFKEIGISPDRLRVIDPVPARADVHQVLATADIYLDPYPFAGACSMLDPCIMAIPPVVRSGPVGRSLHGATIMRMVGIEEVICASEESYISTAIDLALNPARRERIRAALCAANARQPPPYFDTRLFSSNVGKALTDIHEQYLAPYHALRIASPEQRRITLQNLADSVVSSSLELADLNDMGIVQSLIEPYFKQADSARRLHMVDVGACDGRLAEPMLADGWSADLFEPDPRTRATLKRSMEKHGSRCRIFDMAVTNSEAREVAFHQTHTGLSGLGMSPFGATEAVLTVPSTQLAKFYVEHNVKFVDFLKIDAEGFDFDVLSSHDFKKMQPPLVMVEYGTHFATESLPIINQAIARMATAGYGSVVFNCFDDGNFSEGKFIYRLTHILLDQPLPDLGRVAFGDILFYRSNDVAFLLTLYALLDICRARAGAV